jgi:hypothetical protein
LARAIPYHILLAGMAFAYFPTCPRLFVIMWFHTITAILYQVRHRPDVLIGIAFEFAPSDLYSCRRFSKRKDASEPMAAGDRLIAVPAALIPPTVTR